MVRLLRRLVEHVDSAVLAGAAAAAAGGLQEGQHLAGWAAHEAQAGHVLPAAAAGSVGGQCGGWQLMVGGWQLAVGSRWLVVGTEACSSE